LADYDSSTYDSLDGLAVEDKGLLCVTVTEDLVISDEVVVNNHFEKRVKVEHEKI